MFDDLIYIKKIGYNLNIIIIIFLILFNKKELDHLAMYI